MHIRSKFDGGKQVNRSQSGSWEGRCAGAGLRANEGPEWGPACWDKAASPDGIVYDPSFNPPQGLVELKNPYSARDKTVEEAASSKSFCLKLDNGGKLCLPKNHNYYYQIQCAMYCTNRQWYDLVVMTKNLHIERITVDPQFEKKIIPKLKEYYFTAVLPELASPQAVIREPCQWLTKEWEFTCLQLDSC